MTAMGSAFFTQQPLVGVIIMIAMAAVKHVIAYLEFFSNQSKLVTLYELSHLSVSTHGTGKNATTATPAEIPQQIQENAFQKTAPMMMQKTVKPQETEPQEPEPHEPTPPNTLVAPQHGNAHTVGQQKMNRRYEELRMLLEEKRVWQDENLSAQSICDMMNIGKTTLSALISHYYDTSFRELVNRYRIEEAMRYMKAHPEQTQETVAMHCGFRNAQYFNTQFHKHVGITPAVWMASGCPNPAER